MSDNKRAGTLYEQMFVVEALSRGLDISVPVGDYSQYDAIIDNGSSLVRCQVKGTASERKDRSGAFSISCGMGNKTSQKSRYKDTAYDLLVALVLKGGDRFWYIIPRSAVGSNLTLKLFPNPTSQGKWEKYRHGWDLICKM